MHTLHWNGEAKSWIISNNEGALFKTPDLIAAVRMVNALNGGEMHVNGTWQKGAQTGLLIQTYEIEAFC